MVFAFSNLDFLVNYLKSCQKSHHVVAFRRDSSRAVEENCFTPSSLRLWHTFGVQHFSLYKDIFFSSYIIEIFTKPTDFQQCGACETHCRFADLSVIKNILRWLSLLKLFNILACMYSEQNSFRTFCFIEFYMFLSSFGL